MRGSARPHLNYKLIIGWQCRQEMGKIPNFTAGERLKTLKMDCVLKVYKDKEFCQLGLQVCWPWKFRGACHLNYKHIIGNADRKLRKLYRQWTAEDWLFANQKKAKNSISMDSRFGDLKNTGWSRCYNLHDCGANLIKQSTTRVYNNLYQSCIRPMRFARSKTIVQHCLLLCWIVSVDRLSHMHASRDLL